MATRGAWTTPGDRRAAWRAAFAAGAAALLFCACAAKNSARIEPLPRSADDHLASAEEHEREAKDEEAASRTSVESREAPYGMECFDTPMDDISTSGTERLRPLRPCWTDLTRPAGDHEQRAHRHRNAAAVHRAKAKGLVEVERRSCAGLGVDEISLSPFHHTEDILSVSEYREKGVLRGARVVFRKLGGLNAEWFQRSATCHQARAALMGYPTTFMPYCPMSIQDVQVSARDTEEGLEVIVRSDNEVAAAAVYGRVRDLLDPNHPFHQHK